MRMNKRSIEFKCKTCGQSFATYQALGGHRTGHTRPKAVADIKKLEAKFHKCEFCGLSFLMGQALGGHMRRHKNAAKELALFSYQPEKRSGRKGISLNLELSSILMDGDEDN